MPADSPIDDYLAKLAEDKRAVLEKLRKTIRSAAPKAVECVSYGMPAFKLDGKGIAGFAAARNHFSYFPMSGSVVSALKKDLEKFETSKGAVKFTAESPIPATLVRKLVRARIAEIRAN